jgi:hypothetical protein
MTRIGELRRRPPAAPCQAPLENRRKDRNPMLTSTGLTRLMAAAALLLAASCQMTTESFGGSGGSFEQSGGSFGGTGGTTGGSGDGSDGGSDGGPDGGTGTDAGQTLARDVCVRTAQQRGKIVAGVERTQPVMTGGSAVGADVYLQLRRDPMTVSTTVARCRFTYANGEAFIFGI